MQENTGTQLTDLTVISRNTDYTVYELTFERDGMMIYGELFYPDQKSPTATVIIGHGFGETYQSTEDDAEAFATAGIAAYVFDFCGGSPYSSSDGSMTEMSVLTERDDMEAVLDGLCSCTFVDAENIFLMGESQGGFVAALLAAKRPEDVRGLVLFYPALVIPDNARAQFDSADDVPETSRVFGMTVGRNYYTDILAMDPFAEISVYTGDVLIVHGDQDSIVPISYSSQAAEAYPSAELVTISGGGHGFYGTQLEMACADAVDFVVRHELSEQSVFSVSEVPEANIIGSSACRLSCCAGLASVAVLTVAQFQRD
ncbi:MAG: YqiA/YcfP family alpha/beta fold hydrolase [Eubacteriales bacterium]|nr:YqiA/YcfP family alpha/beta fold hydrolase [Eubacteriales bacterium]